MAPKFEWLQTRLDLDDAQLRKVAVGAGVDRRAKLRSRLP